MANHQVANAGSLVRSGEIETMEVETAHRWRCGCGAVGPWRVRDLKGLPVGGPDRPTLRRPAHLTRLFADWRRHAAEEHPDADLTFEEWEPEEDPE